MSLVVSVDFVPVMIEETHIIHNTLLKEPVLGKLPGLHHGRNDDGLRRVGAGRELQARALDGFV